MKILLADDEPSLRLTVGDALEDAGHDVIRVSDGAQAWATLREQAFDVLLTDIRMPHLDGLSLFEKLRQADFGVDVIFMTAYGDVEDAVTALKAGAADYLTKPFDNDELLLRLGRISQRRELHRDLADARRQLSKTASALILGKSNQVQDLVQRIETVGPSNAAILVLGESGTGKELVARALHATSPRAERPFVPVNCAAFPDTLIEAELFGHEKGAFTGAERKREGRFQVAHGGTLFLDEIAEIPMMVQAKLLRVLQEGIVEPIGSDKPVRVDARVICATHRNLKQRIHDGSFREDLYYRINVIDIEVPPLRKRRADIPLLVEHFTRKFSPGRESVELSDGAWGALQAYSFPGNVRELEHAIHHGVVLSRGRTIRVEHLPTDIAGHIREDGAPASAAVRPLSEAMREFERAHLLRALSQTDGARGEAAKLLGISRKNLWEKLRSHGISDSDLDEG